MADANFKITQNVLTASGTIDRRRNPNKIVAQHKEAMMGIKNQKEQENYRNKDDPEEEQESEG